jgi:hypothetical protein
LRWLVERIDRNHAETTADIAKLDAQVAAIPAVMDRYVLSRVYEADEKAREAREGARDARIKRIEDDGSNKTRGVRSAWLAGISATASAVLIESVNALMRSGGH